MTREMFPITEVPQVRTFTLSELKFARNLGEAYEVTMRRSGLQRKQLSELTGIAPETLSMMASGKRNCPIDKTRKFFEACGNTYALQWQLDNWFGLDIERERQQDLFIKSA